MCPCLHESTVVRSHESVRTCIPESTQPDSMHPTNAWQTEATSVTREAWRSGGLRRAIVLHVRLPHLTLSTFCKPLPRIRQLSLKPIRSRCALEEKAQSQTGCGQRLRGVPRRRQPIVHFNALFPSNASPSVSCVFGPARPVLVCGRRALCYVS